MTPDQRELLLALRGLSRVFEKQGHQKKAAMTLAADTLSGLRKQAEGGFMDQVSGAAGKVGDWWNAQSPELQNSLKGGVAGAIGGGLYDRLRSRENWEEDPSVMSTLGSALWGGGLGGAAGGLYGHYGAPRTKAQQDRESFPDSTANPDSVSGKKLWDPKGTGGVDPKTGEQIYGGKTIAEADKERRVAANTPGVAGPLAAAGLAAGGTGSVVLGNAVRTGAVPLFSGGVTPAANSAYYAAQMAAQEQAYAAAIANGMTDFQAGQAAISAGSTVPGPAVAGAGRLTMAGPAALLPYAIESGRFAYGGNAGQKAMVQDAKKRIRDLSVTGSLEAGMNPILTGLIGGADVLSGRGAGDQMADLLSTAVPGGAGPGQAALGAKDLFWGWGRNDRARNDERAAKAIPQANPNAGYAGAYNAAMGTERASMGTDEWGKIIDPEAAKAWLAARPWGDQTAELWNRGRSQGLWGQ